MTRLPVPTSTTEAARGCVDRIKQMAGSSVTRERLSQMVSELEALSRRKELFTRDVFPPPQGPTNILYEVTSDPDGQFTLYVSSANKGKETPPHNHSTWAIITAVAGDELNKLYKRLDDGSNNNAADIVEDRQHTVRVGAPIALMPDDIHSIHVLSDEPTLHLHLYGRRLSDLKDRLQFDVGARKAEWFPPNPNIL